MSKLSAVLGAEVGGVMEDILQLSGLKSVEGSTRLRRLYRLVVGDSNAVLCSTGCLQGKKKNTASNRYIVFKEHDSKT